MDRLLRWWNEIIFPLLIWAAIAGAVWGWFVWRDQAAQKKVLGLGGVIAQAQQAIATHRLSPSFNTQNPDEAADQIVGFLVNSKDRPYYPDYGLDYPHGAASQGAFSGPVMAIDIGRDRPDAAFGKLPADQRAPSLSAARTVVFIRCTPIKVGTYRSALDAYSTVCDALALDRGTPGGPQVVSTFHVESRPPQKVLMANHWFKVVGARPNKAIADWIEARLGLAQGG